MARLHNAPRESTVWLTTSEASQFLGVSANTIRIWANAGILKSYRTAGNHRRFHKSDLLAYLGRDMQRVGTND